MRKFKYISFLIAGFLTGLAAMAQSGMKSRSLADTFADESYVSQFMRYQRYMPFIKYSDNYIEWKDAAAIDNFYVKLAHANTKKVNILHIGDSHIQADFFTGYIRENIQRVFGYGGRGFIFPYACAGTHSTYDYRTWKYGAWEGARNVKNPGYMDMGITGAVAKTNDDNAGFKFGFKEGIMMPDFTVLKIYCKKSEQSFNLKLKLDNYDDTIYLSANARPDKPYIQVNLPLVADTFEVFMNKTDSLQNFFECYGLMIESCKDNGVLYNSVGINGAGFNSVLGQTLMTSQLNDLKPDLVIIDIGANDYYGYTYDEKMLGDNLAMLIQTIKVASPNTSVVVSCSQDIYRKRKNVYATQPFSQMIQKVAGQNSAAWYDYFSISGGRYSMLKWRRYQLAKKDKVHLTTAGYHLKGDLYLNAMLNSYLQYLKGRPESLLVSNGNLVAVSDSAFIDKGSLVDPETDTTKTKIIHTVKKKEKLAAIAKKYKVDAEDIMDWNGLETATLRKGQKLEIFIDKQPGTEIKENITEPLLENPTPAPKKVVPQKTPPQKKTTGTVKYKVKPGDTLWSIAQKHGVTVAQIKKLNGMRSDAIRAGQVLIIK